MAGNVTVMLIALRMPIVMVLMMQTMMVFDGTEGIDNTGVDGTVIVMLMVPMMTPAEEKDDFDGNKLNHLSFGSPI